MSAGMGPADLPDFTLSAPAASLIAGMVYGKMQPETLAEAGLSVTGDRAQLERFVDLFHLPAKAG